MNDRPTVHTTACGKRKQWPYFLQVIWHREHVIPEHMLEEDARSVG